MNKTDHKINQLERKVRGMQVQIEKLSSQSSKNSRAIRDLEIKNAVLGGVPQRKVAEIFELSASRVNQIARKAI